MTILEKIGLTLIAIAVAIVINAQPVEHLPAQEHIAPPIEAMRVAERIAGMDRGPPSDTHLRNLERKHDLPTCLLSAVMRVESSGNPDAVSRKGATGLFQFMPATARQYGIDPLDPHQAADGAARMLAGLRTRYGGNLTRMLAAYNWGPTNLDRHGLKRAPLETRRHGAKVKAARLLCLGSKADEYR